jgi:hypothetical protein
MIIDLPSDSQRSSRYSTFADFFPISPPHFPSILTTPLFFFFPQLKFEVLEQLQSKMEPKNVLKIDGMTVKFCGKNDDVPKAEAHCLPVMMHTCPDDFSTLDYFDVSRRGEDEEV